MDAEEEELGFLDKLADTEVAMGTLGQALGTASAITEEITRLLNDSVEKIRSLPEAPGYASAKLAIANRLGALLQEPATKLEVTAGEYAQSIARIEPGIVYLLEAAAAEPEQLKAAPEFVSQMRAMMDAAASAVQNTLLFKRSFDESGNAARLLRRVMKRIALALQSIATSSERVASWRTLLDKLHA